MCAYRQIKCVWDKIILMINFWIYYVRREFHVFANLAFACHADFGNSVPQIIVDFRLDEYCRPAKIFLVYQFCMNVFDHLCVIDCIVFKFVPKNVCKTVAYTATVSEIVKAMHRYAHKIEYLFVNGIVLKLKELIELLRK